MEYLHTNRVIVLVDMDCFYCQVEEKLDPKLIGKPIAVVQYNAWRGGGIIAVNYPARAKGVTRHMRGDEAKKKCPEIILASVPTVREKADLTKYRDAGKEVAAVLQTYTDLLERASVDEAYMDITDAVNKRIQRNCPITADQLQNTFVVGCDTKDFVDNFKHEHYIEGNFKLCMGGIIAEEIRAAVFSETGYRCSAGIAHNKILAKLACGMHKPNQQTILPQDGVDELFSTLPLRKIRTLGGQFGNNLGDDLGIKTMGELKKFSERDLISRYDNKTGSWLYKIARGINLEPVTIRLVSKSIGCCKKFPGKTALTTPEDVHHWINQLSIEISERLHKDLEENNRKARHIVVGFVQEIDREDISNTRTHPLQAYESDKIAADMLKVINKHCLQKYGFYCLKYLGISAGKFEDCKKGYDISAYFKNCNKQNNIPSSESHPTDGTREEIINEINNTNITELKSGTGRPSDEFTDDNEQCSINKDDSNQSCDSQHSIFSQNTTIMDFNEADLIYNTNYKPIENFFSQSPIITNEDSNTDSITDEITNNYVEESDIIDRNTPSYFSNYFKNGTCERNFNTSRYLEENEENELDSEDSESLKSSSHKSAAEENYNFGVSEVEENNETERSNLVTNYKYSNTNIFQNMLNEIDERDDDTSKERCQECNKLILKTEMLAHMDYHFAINMVRKEAHLYSQPNVANVSKKCTEVKPNKRKRCEVVSAKLTSFFENKLSEDVPTQTCSECNKEIPVDKFLNHLDYHIAKKLHSEINSLNTAATNSGRNSAIAITHVNKRIKEVPKQSNTKNVISFFKKNM